jgi:phage terminase small subunit
MRALPNDRQRRFVMEYLEDMCATQAAIRAGYSSKCARQQASALLSKADIQRALSETRAQLTGRLELDAETTLRLLVETIDDAHAAKQYSAAIAGLRLLGRHLGMFDGQRTEPPLSVEKSEDEDNRTEAQRLAEFAEDVCMLAQQTGYWGESVESFHQEMLRLADLEPEPLA